MQQYEMAQTAIAQKARSERLYMHYALTLAIFLALGGTALVILGIGAHLDIVIAGSDLEARFVNASPGVALWLVSAAVFYFSKPRRLEATASHDEGNEPKGVANLRFSYGAARDPMDTVIEEQVMKVMDPIMDDARAAILGSINEAKRQIQVEMDAVVSFVANERHMLETNTRARASGAVVSSERSQGSSRVFYQEDHVPGREDASIERDGRKSD